MKIRSILISILIYCVSVSVIGYLADCIYNFSRAISNYSYFFLYLTENILFRSFFFFFGFILYTFIFRKVKVKQHVLLKLIVLITLSLVYAKFFYMDVYSMTHDFKQLRLSIACSLSAIFTILMHDFYLAEKTGESNHLTTRPSL